MSAPVRDLSCKELVELVTEYLEGTLPPADRARFDEHVASCPGCTAYLRQMRDTLRVAGRLSEASLSDPARESLLAAFRAWKKS
jgi:anti-sigma factor RsiW